MSTRDHHASSFQAHVPWICKVWYDLRFHLPNHPHPLPFCKKKTHSHDFEMTDCQVFIIFLIWDLQCLSLSPEKQGKKFNPPATLSHLQVTKNPHHCQASANGF